MNGPATPVLEAHRLSVTYGRRCALQPTDLAVWPGESVAIVGRNGSGKSSLLRALSGIEPAARGEVVLHAESCHHIARSVEVAYVPQRSEARWDLPFTAGQVVAAGCLRNRWWRRGSHADRAAVSAALAAVGLADLADRAVSELSGGQAQRVLLARALAQQPDVLLMDEPLTGLDLETVDTVLTLVHTLTDGNMAVCCVLHEVDIARESFSRVIALCGGAVVADGPAAGVLDAHGVESIFLRRVAV